MKPHPSLVGAALEIAAYPPTSCALIGDSQSDMQAAHAWGVAAVGYGKTPKRYAELRDGDADAVFENWSELL
jgi:phosphoglycolate phosphatase-like HAD superfamily hydrolase